MKNGNLTGDDLRGVWTAMITPFKRGRADVVKLSELVRKAAKAEITGIVPLGTTGESPTVRDEDRECIISTVVKSAADKLLVMVGVGTNNTYKTIDNIKHAFDLGADAVLIVTPYYNKPTPEGLKNHFLTIADASDLPIVLYHIPSRCGVGIPLGLVLELAEHPRIIGIKEAGGDVWRSGEIARLTRKDFAVLSGDDALTLPLMSVGAVGVISVVSNIAPKMFRKMTDMCLAGDLPGAMKIHQKLSPLLGALGLETNPAPVKEAMNILGMKVGKVNPPLASVRPDTRRALRAAISEIGRIE